MEQETIIYCSECQQPISPDQDFVSLKFRAAMPTDSFISDFALEIAGT